MTTRSLRPLRSLCLLAALRALPAAAADLAVNPDAGNNSLAAVFDAALGERIAAARAVGVRAGDAAPRLRPPGPPPCSAQRWRW